jgi:hypothetical protein
MRGSVGGGGDLEQAARCCGEVIPATPALRGLVQGGTSNRKIAGQTGVSQAWMYGALFVFGFGLLIWPGTALLRWEDNRPRGRRRKPR